MDENSDYVDQLSAFAQKFNKASLEGYKLYTKVLGTNVVVSRVEVAQGATSIHEKDAERYHRLLKSSMTVSESATTDTSKTFNYRILINKNQISQRYGKSTDTVKVVVMEDVFKPGDVITYKFRGLIYRLKVTHEIEVFGSQEDQVYVLTLSQFKETR